VNQNNLGHDRCVNLSAFNRCILVAICEERQAWIWSTTEHSMKGVCSNCQRAWKTKLDSGLGGFRVSGETLIDVNTTCLIGASNALIIVHSTEISICILAILLHIVGDLSQHLLCDLPSFTWSFFGSTFSMLNLLTMRNFPSPCQALLQSSRARKHLIWVMNLEALSRTIYINDWRSIDECVLYLPLFVLNQREENNNWKTWKLDQL
jgi:hypothetical protein